MKNTDSAEKKGYDTGKKVSGIKRPIVVDTQGSIHAIAFTPADVTERAGALQTIKHSQKNLSSCSRVLVDGSYTAEPFVHEVKTLLGATVQVAKRSELCTFAVMPKRWIVERTLAWLEKCRRLWKNPERKLNTSLQFVILAHLAMLLKRSCTGSKSW